MRRCLMMLPALVLSREFFAYLKKSQNPTPNYQHAD